jgi:lysophospholipase L1-like esterase
VREIVDEAKTNGQDVELIDLWKALADEAVRLTAGCKEGEGEKLGTRETGDSEALRKLLVDGLHLTGEGYRIFLAEVSPSPSSSRNGGNSPYIIEL